MYLRVAEEHVQGVFIALELSFGERNLVKIATYVPVRQLSSDFNPSLYEI